MFGIQKDTLVHFVGIGGIGMSGIAEVLLGLGHKVSGSDISDGPVIEKLRRLGAKIFLKHEKENLSQVDLLVFSSAIQADNPELIEAKDLGLPIIKRAEMLAEIMRLKYGLAVAGTHGKTTTTSILATIMLSAGLDPTYVIGGVVRNLGKHSQVGADKLFVAEADESDGSFLYLNPIFSIITNIDLDHLDFYQNEQNLLEAFATFANKVPFYGRVVINAHDIRIKKILNQIKRPLLSFGIEEKVNFLGELDHEAKNVEYLENQTRFDWYSQGVFQEKMELALPGEHNVLNALGAIAAAHQLKLPSQKIKKGLSDFRGVGRRLELIWQRPGQRILDDYAHHPTEIRETLRAATISSDNKEKLVVFFQPHRFSRTQNSWADFVQCFGHAVKVYILPIYGAGEASISGISSENLALAICKQTAVDCQAIPEDQFSKLVSECLSNGKTILTLGAGSIGRQIRAIVAEL